MAQEKQQAQQQNVTASQQQQSPQEQSGQGGRQGGLSLADPWRPVSNLRRQIDSLFEEFNRMMPFGPTGRSIFDMEPFARGGSPWGGMPAVDIVEQDNAIQISAELPGMDENNIELKLANNVLTLKGEKKDEREEKEQGYYLSERSYGSFQRSFNLPDSVDIDKIEAHFDKGVLKVTLPKKSEAQQQEKRIDIRRGAGGEQGQQDQAQQGGQQQR